jgi:hypothetical protein
VYKNALPDEPTDDASAVSKLIDPDELDAPPPVFTTT